MTKQKMFAHSIKGSMMYILKKQPNLKCIFHVYSNPHAHLNHVHGMLPRNPFKSWWRTWVGKLRFCNGIFWLVYFTKRHIWKGTQIWEAKFEVDVWNPVKHRETVYLFLNMFLFHFQACIPDANFFGNHPPGFKKKEDMLTKRKKLEQEAEKKRLEEEVLKYWVGVGIRGW